MFALKTMLCPGLNANHTLHLLTKAAVCMAGEKEKEEVPILLRCFWIIFGHLFKNTCLSWIAWCLNIWTWTVPSKLQLYRDLEMRAKWWYPTVGKCFDLFINSLLDSTFSFSSHELSRVMISLKRRHKSFQLFVPFCCGEACTPLTLT